MSRCRDCNNDCSKKSNKHDNKCKTDWIDRLKVKFLKAKKVCAFDVKATTVKVTTVKATTIDAKTANFEEMNATTIALNGQDLACLLARTPVEAQAIPFALPEPLICQHREDAQNLKPPTVDQRVWDALFDNSCFQLNGPYVPDEPIPPCFEWAIAEGSIVGTTLTISQFLYGDASNIIPNSSIVTGDGVLVDTLVVSGGGFVWQVDQAQNVANTRLSFKTPDFYVPEGLRARIQCGREFTNQFLAEKNCPRPCPSCPTDPQSTEPCRVPMDIHAIKTFPIFTRGPSCRPGEFQNEFVLAVSYILNVDYQLEIAGSTEARVVSVLCQLSYIDFNGEPVVKIIDIGNKQFYPTLDVCYGEKYTGQINIPSSLIQTAYLAMPDVNNTGAVQLVVYSEEGVQVTEGGSCGNMNGISSKQVTEFAPPADTVRTAGSPVIVLISITPSSGPPGTPVRFTYRSTEGPFCGALETAVFGETATDFSGGPVEGGCGGVAIAPAGSGTVQVFLRGEDIESTRLPFTYT